MRAGCPQSWVNDMNKNHILIGFLLLAMAVKVTADFAQTPLYFTVPMDLSFSLLTMTGGNTYTNSSNTSTVANYPTSETYYFNTTQVTNGTMVPPCTGGASPICQLGNANRPGWRIENTGNVNITIGAKLNTSISLSGITMCINSTKVVGCGGTAFSLACNAGSSQGGLNTTGGVIGTQLSSYSMGGNCFSLNVSVFANFSSAQVGTSPGTTSVLFNSTAA